MNSLVFMRCQEPRILSGDGVQSSELGGQVPSNWTSVLRSGLQCWGRMMRWNTPSRDTMCHTWPWGLPWVILNERKRCCGDYYGRISAISFLIVTAIFDSMLSLFGTLDFLPPMHNLEVQRKYEFFHVLNVLNREFIDFETWCGSQCFYL